MQTLRPTLPARVLLGIGICLFAATSRAQDSAFLRERVFGKLAWRSVGPANFGGRVTDLAVDPRNSAVYYVAIASGGLFKTTNNGTTFAPVFDGVASFSIGAVAVAPSAPDVVWVGTGEANNQRSCYWGDGVYRSADAGKTWQHVGLRGTNHIGRIVVDPRNPDVAWVAAAGALFTANAERGLYRTRDGGASWECVNFISDAVGFIDVAIDPQHPDTLYAASYERRRRPHNIDEGGPGSALWKTTDGGDTWTKLGGGLPSGEIGRIGVAVSASHPDVVYATVENLNPLPQPDAIEPTSRYVTPGSHRPSAPR